MKTMRRKASVVIEKDEDGFYASCLELKGWHSQGRTRDEAIANIREAIELYLETLTEEERCAALSRHHLNNDRRSSGLNSGFIGPHPCLSVGH
jgi:predicted RNase H-like HicB family nuclease